MTAEELLSTASEVEETEEVCVIDAETRSIYVPECYSVIGVESDEKVKRIKFVCPAVVNENINLLDYSLRIVYRNANKNKYPPYIVTDAVQNGDNIEFSWLLSRAVTAYKGTVDFVFCAVKVDADDMIEHEWNTTLASAKVLEGLKPDTFDIEESKEDIIAQLVSSAVKRCGANWNQNDPTASDYVKGRTHWEEVTMVEVVSEATWTYDSDYSGYPIESDYTFVDGETYIVNWNGVEYTCVAQDMEMSGDITKTVNVLGNVGSKMGGEDTGEPFVMMSGNADGIIMAMPLDGSTSITLSIAQETRTIHHLDPKYIKDMYYTDEKSIILPESNISVAFNEDMGGMYLGTTDFSNFDLLIDGELYTITFNSVEYISKCTAIDYASFVLGNMVLVGGEDSGEPFLIVLNQGSLTVASLIETEVTCSIAGKTIHPIKRDFIEEPALIDLTELDFPSVQVGTKARQTITINQFLQICKSLRCKIVKLRFLFTGSLNPIGKDDEFLTFENEPMNVFANVSFESNTINSSGTTRYYLSSLFGDIAIYAAIRYDTIELNIRRLTLEETTSAT